MSKYLEFLQIPYRGGKTKRFEVLSKNCKQTLGRIMWERGWRQYIFSPSYPTIWSRDCLKDIQDFLQQLMDERNIAKIYNKGLMSKEEAGKLLKFPDPICGYGCDDC
jgi:hypothetical protein